MEQILTLKDGYTELVQKFYPLLERASQRGIPIDSEERDKLIIDLEKERASIYADIQARVPDECRKIHPTKGYVRDPPIAVELVGEYNSWLPEMERVAQLRGKRVISLADYVMKKSRRQIVKDGEPTQKWERLRYGQFKHITEGLEEVTEGRWFWVEDFNPNSGKQIIKFMKAVGHRVPVTLDGDETTEAKELERLALSTGDVFYDWIIEYRQLNKMLTNDIPNWSPHEKTRAVHTEFGFHPATLQISSRGPNVQNANKHKPLGKRFRRIVRARDYRDGRWAGRRRRLVEVDYSGFHAIMLGREAQSERYINISKADAHSFLTSYIVGKPVEYPSVFSSGAYGEFKAKLKAIKAEYKVIRDTQAKPTILGVGLGLGPRKMYWMNRPKLDRKSGVMVGIQSEAQSKKFQGILKELLGELFIYQEHIKDLAFRQTYLINRWGAIRWFFDVRGEDGEAAIAFNVQGNAHGMLRWVIRRLQESEEFRYDCDPMDYIWTPDGSVSGSLVGSTHSNTGKYEGAGILQVGDKWDRKISALERFQFIDTIHDSLIFEPWEDEVELCVREVSRCMETPCKVLADSKVCPGGLVVGVEATVGENWAEWDEKLNPGGMKVWIPTMTPQPLKRAA